MGTAPLPPVMLAELGNIPGGRKTTEDDGRWRNLAQFQIGRIGAGNRNSPPTPQKKSAQKLWRPAPLSNVTSAELRNISRWNPQDATEAGCS